MAAFKIQRLHSADVGDFTETVDFSVLQCTNVEGNNNKFYCIEIQRNVVSDNYRIFSHYGRLESSSVYEKREFNGNGEVLTERDCRVGYDAIIKKKLRGKNVKRGDITVREEYALVDVLSPSVGSRNICNSTTVAAANTPMIDTSSYDMDSSRVIQLIVQENIHDITTNTSLSFTSNGFETSLGPVTEAHITKATIELNNIRDLISNNADINEIKTANSKYLTLIPRKVSNVISESDIVTSPDDIANEYSLLDNLKTAVRSGLTSDTKEKSTIDIHRITKNDPEYTRLEHKFENTKHRNHTNIRDYKITNIYALNVPKSTNKFDESLGNVKELFHGTKTANMLSITLNGLIIPPTGAAHVTGRMFGNGVYAASCSTKALNYAVGYWDRQQTTSTSVFVLIVQMAMGNEYEAKSHLYSGAPQGYDSIWAKAGTSLLNDEFIVYNLNQVKITHILELQK